MSHPDPPEPEVGDSRRGGALAVGAGILASRVAGLVRAAATSAAFGVGPFADVFQTALRAPNILQNLLGEQALSASFIPVYSRFLGRRDREGGRRFAGAAFGLLLVVAAGLALAGILAARPIVALFAAGYLRDATAVAAGTATVDRYELAVTAVRWIFPMTGLLVLSAWALGVLNSHRRFFLPYVAPVAWNAAIVAALWLASDGAFGLTAGDAGAGERLVIAACIGALVGGALQLVVQVPAVLRELGGLRLSLSRSVAGVREALSAFAPALAGRGVVQLSSYLDQLLASLLAVGAVSALGYAQMLYLLPVSLFGQAIAASALPELARSLASRGEAEVAAGARRSLGDAELLFWPATVALAGFAPAAVSGLYQLLPGSFGAAEVALVATVLTIYALGLPASIPSRVLQTSFFALGDTRTPAKVAALRVGVSAAVAVPAMLWLDRLPVARIAVELGDSPLRLGAIGLALGSTIAAWLERWLLGRSLAPRLRGFAPRRIETVRGVASALAAAAPAWWVGELVAGAHPTLRATALFGTYAASYLVATRLTGGEGISRLLRRRRAR